MTLFLILEHPVSIPALTSWLPQLSQYHVKLGPHIYVRDISWVNACVLSLPARKRSRILALFLCLAGHWESVVCWKGAQMLPGWTAFPHPISITQGSLLAPRPLSLFALQAMNGYALPFLLSTCHDSRFTWIFGNGEASFFVLWGLQTFRYFRPAVITHLLLKPVETFLTPYLRGSLGQ